MQIIMMKKNRVCYFVHTQTLLQKCRCIVLILVDSFLHYSQGIKIPMYFI